MAKRKSSDQKYYCNSCFRREPLTRDEVGITKKLLGEDARVFFCLPCLAEYLECTEEELLEKIEQFKEEGCKLFG